MIQNQNTYVHDVYLFYMSICVAHEIIHLLAGFLTGTEDADTPPEVNGPGYGTSVVKLSSGRRRAVGESGRAWEQYTFGGVITVYADPSRRKAPVTAEEYADPLKLDDHLQPGIPWIFDTHHWDSYGVRVSTDFIQKIARGDVMFTDEEVRDSGPSRRRDSLDRHCSSMDDLRADGKGHWRPGIGTSSTGRPRASNSDVLQPDDALQSVTVVSGSGSGSVLLS